MRGALPTCSTIGQDLCRRKKTCTLWRELGTGGLEWTIYTKVKSRQKEDAGEAERETSKAGNRENHRRPHLTLISVGFLMKMWC